MNAHPTADRLVEEYEQGRVTRRQLVAGLVALGAAAASGKAAPRLLIPQDAAAAQERPTFQATGLDHIALRVTDVERSAAFYRRHLGLRGDAGGGSAFLAPPEGEFVLALFRGEQAGMDHYCYAIRGYDAGQAVEKLTAAGLEPRRQGNRVYFDDPDGIEVQIEA